MPWWAWLLIALAALVSGVWLGVLGGVAWLGWKVWRRT
jgi:hypothetical protein